MEWRLVQIRVNKEFNAGLNPSDGNLIDYSANPFIVR
jgi:hypothetical protein